jgi:hypothetical protein
MELWVGCVAGALEVGEFESLLASAGFENPNIEPTRVYMAEDAREFIEGAGMNYDEFSGAVSGKFMAAFVRGTKPMHGGRKVPTAAAETPAAAAPAAASAKSCCGPDCCS